MATIVPISYKSIIRWIILAVVILSALALGFGSFTIVGAGERGVVLNWGAFQGQIMNPGLNFKIPLVQNVKSINVQTQSLQVDKSEAYSKDLQIVVIHSVINYNAIPERVGEFYQQYDAAFDNLLIPRLEAAVKQTVAKYTAEELLQKRGEVQEEIEKNFSANVPNVVQITKYSLVNEQFSQAFEEAIEKKQVAQQDAERAQNELKKVQIEAEQRVAQAKAEAEAIKIQAEAIQQQGGQAYVQLQAISKWDGKLPQQMIPGSAVPFINLNNK